MLRRMLFVAVVTVLSVTCLPAQNGSVNPTPHVPRTGAAMGAESQEVPISRVSLSTLNQCELQPADYSIVTDIKTAFEADTKMIKYHLHIRDPERVFKNQSESEAYQLFYWVRSTGRHGTGLLLLRPDYDVLSLSTLELGVLTMDVDLVERPEGCLDRLTTVVIERLLRELVMNDFQNTTSGELVQLKPTDNVCNMHAVNDDGTASYRYVCCQRDNNLHLTCSYLVSDIWLNILLATITLVKIFAVLFSPKLVPETLYRLNHFARPFIYRKKPFKVKVIRSRTPSTYLQPESSSPSGNPTVIKSKKFRLMPKFEETLGSLIHDVPYTMTINHLHMRVKSAHILPEDYAPVGLMTTLYQSFVKCGIRDRSSVAECCNADVFSSVNCTNKTCSWHRLLKQLMAFLLLMLLALPWIIRVYVYFRYEHEEMQQRKDFAEARGLRFYFPGSVTRYLTPLHILFVFIYVVLSVESVTYGVIGKQAKEKFKFVLRKCFSDMADREKLSVIGWLVNNMLRPCTAFGGFGMCIGLFLFIIFSPFIFIIFAFYMLPTLNLTCRLFAHLTFYLCPNIFCFSKTTRLLSCFLRFQTTIHTETISDKETLEKDESILKHPAQRAQQVFIIALCMISLWSLVFLITELVSFAVEVVVYTLMGLILHATLYLTYVSLFFVLVLYANDCFSTVAQTYLKFNQTIHSVVTSNLKAKFEKEISKNAEKQSNLVYRMPIDATVPNGQVEVADRWGGSGVRMELVDGIPQWRTSRLLLFLTRFDTPMIPKRFFFDCCKMPYYNVPGELLLKYLFATLECVYVVMFLLFVLVVVLAFGDAYNVSATNKLLMTVAGGILPFMLKQVVLKSHSVKDVDTSDIHFKVAFNNIVRQYEEHWPVYDIDVQAIELDRADFSPGPRDGLLVDLLVDESETPGGGDVPDAACVRRTRYTERDIGSMSMLDGYEETEENTLKLIVKRPD